MGKSQIAALPLEADRAALVEIANVVFETILERLDLENPDPVRKLWKADDYIDHAFFLREDTLPMSFEYASYLIDAFLVHHVLGLIDQTVARLRRKRSPRKAWLFAGPHTVRSGGSRTRANDATPSGKH